MFLKDYSMEALLHKTPRTLNNNWLSSDLLACYSKYNAGQIIYLVNEMPLKKVADVCHCIHT